MVVSPGTHFERRSGQSLCRIWRKLPTAVSPPVIHARTGGRPESPVAYGSVKISAEEYHSGSCWLVPPTTSTSACATRTCAPRKSGASVARRAASACRWPARSPPATAPCSVRSPPRASAWACALHEQPQSRAASTRSGSALESQKEEVRAPLRLSHLGAHRQSSSTRICPAFIRPPPKSRPPPTSTKRTTPRRLYRAAAGHHRGNTGGPLFTVERGSGLPSVSRHPRISRRYWCRW